MKKLLLQILRGYIIEKLKANGCYTEFINLVLESLELPLIGVPLPDPPYPPAPVIPDPLPPVKPKDPIE